LGAGAVGKQQHNPNLKKTNQIRGLTFQRWDEVPPLPCPFILANFQDRQSGLNGGKESWKLRNFQDVGAGSVSLRKLFTFRETEKTTFPDLPVAPKALLSNPFCSSFRNHGDDHEQMYLFASCLLPGDFYDGLYDLPNQ
jgi:hypothetical protein